MKHTHHILPKHAGGTDDPNNLVSLTPAEHAEAHRLLYEEYGRWQDYVAWKGLAKLSTNQDHIRLLLRESGRAGAKISNKNWNSQRRSESRTRMLALRCSVNYNGADNPNSKVFEITFPNGKTEIVNDLPVWCQKHLLNYNSFYNQCIGRKSKHKGYAAKRIS